MAIAFAEIPATIVETALTFVPALLNVPVLGRILLIFSPHGGNDFRALEEAQRLADKRKTERQTQIARNARYVLKASDAMQCVDMNLNVGSVYLSIAKAVVNGVLGRPNQEAGDLLNDRIFACIESKVLKQTSRRTKRTGTFQHRPSLGHGKGRKPSVKKP